MKKTQQDYYYEILDIHNKIFVTPTTQAEYKFLQEKLSSRFNKWLSFCSVVVRVAGNEQKPWTEKELGLVTLPMELKSSSGYDQVGDYQFEILTNDHIVIPGGLVIERKEVSDFYGTMMNKDNRERFYREIDRFQADLRLNSMIIIVEGTMKEFKDFKPPFIGNKFNRNHTGASVESRRGTVAGLFMRGVPVLFTGSRAEAVKVYKSLIRQWCFKNKLRILFR